MLNSFYVFCDMCTLYLLEKNIMKNFVKIRTCSIVSNVSYKHKSIIRFSYLRKLYLNMKNWIPLGVTLFPICLSVMPFSFRTRGCWNYYQNLNKYGIMKCIFWFNAIKNSLWMLLVLTYALKLEFHF